MSYPSRHDLCQVQRVRMGLSVLVSQSMLLIEPPATVVAWIRGPAVAGHSDRCQLDKFLRKLSSGDVFDLELLEKTCMNPTVHRPMATLGEAVKL